jgi:hypothetical protein
MRLLGMIVLIAIILSSIALGAIGEADKLVYALCLVSAGIVISGYAVLNPKRAQLTVVLPSIHQLTSSEAARLRDHCSFLGQPLPLGETRTAVFRLTTRKTSRIWMGIALGLAFAFLNRDLDPHRDVAALLLSEFFTCLILVGVLVPSVQWFRERHLLNDARFVFATSYGTQTSLKTATRYAFVDHERQYRGGQCRAFASNWKPGELALVFYDQKNPDRNRANFGFFFHELHWGTPAAQAQTSS